MARTVGDCPEELPNGRWFSVKLGREAEGLERPLYPGELGQRIFDNVRRRLGKNGSATKRC